MKLNNSIKIAIANFSLFWKLLLYKIVSIGIGGLFLLPIFRTIKSCLISSGFAHGVKQFFSPVIFKSIPELIRQLKFTFDASLEFVGDLFSTNALIGIYFLLIAFILIPFLAKLSELPSSETIYGFMSSLRRNHFTVNFVNFLPKSLLYSLIRTLLEIPVFLMLFFGVYGFVSLGLSSEFWLYVSPIALFAYVLVLLALNVSLLNAWSSSLVVFNCGVFKGLRKGLCALKRKFGSVMSSFAVIYTIVICLLYGFGLYSFIAIFPFMTLIIAVFGQVLFFESQGMNYYILPDKIIEPKKLEETDNIKKVKFIV